MTRPLAIIFHRLGPYHRVRLEAAAALGPVHAVELSAQTREYAWDPVATGSGLPRTTVFPEGDSNAMPAGEVARRVAGILAGIQPAAVAVNGWSNSGALAGLRWCLAKGTPAILMTESQRRDAARSSIKEGVKAAIVGSFSAALAGGTAHRDYLADLGFPADRVFLGYDAIDNRHFAEGAEAARQTLDRASLGVPERYFLASKRFIPKKNIPLLLEAFAEYRRRATDPWSLVILGDGPMRPAIEATIASLGLGGAVLLPGFRQYAELPAYYAFASGFVHASTVEQWGLVVNEAMAAGLPVAVSEACGSAQDLVVPGHTGWRFDPTSREAITAAMLEMSSDEARRRAFATAAREHVAAWGPERFGQGVWAAARLCAESPRRPTFPTLRRALAGIVR